MLQSLKSMSWKFSLKCACELMMYVYQDAFAREANIWKLLIKMLKIG